MPWDARKLGHGHIEKVELEPTHFDRYVSAVGFLYIIGVYTSE